jgi:hypothetical protein
MAPQWTRLAKRQLPIAIPESIIHMWFRHCTEYTCMFTKLGKGTLLARAGGPQLHGSKQISYNISKYLYYFPLCSREHASSIIKSIAASPVVAGRAFSLHEGVRVHTFAKSPTSVCVRRCNYPAGIRVSKVNSSKRLFCFKFLIGTFRSDSST